MLVASPTKECSLVGPGTLHTLVSRLAEFALRAMSSSDRALSLTS